MFDKAIGLVKSRKRQCGIQGDVRAMYMMDWRRRALYEMCRRVWETLSDNVIDHAGLTARAGKNAYVVLSRQWWRTPCGRFDHERRLLWTAQMLPMMLAL